MPDYDLNRLGSRAFEQMVIALARAEIGSGVEVFGDGPDGGREATFEGTIDWSKTADPEVGDSWTGFTVLQAKFRVKPSSKSYENATWLQGEIRSEIDGWVKAARAGTRDRLPDYLIFVTNVDLSSVPKAGGIDRITTLIKKLLSASDVPAALNVKAFRIWHADQLRSMLDGNQSVRWAYPGLITVGDVLSMLEQDVVSLGSLDVRDPVREELLQGLRTDRWVRLSQSGGPGDAKLWLDDIAIDLPAEARWILTPSRNRVEICKGATDAVRHVLELGDRVLRQRQADREQHPNVVLVGGPGQGKSTLSQLIAQAYRVAMLTDVDLGYSAQEVVDGTRSALARLDLPVPGNRRWPVRIDLAKYAEELAGTANAQDPAADAPGTNLLRWIAAQVTKRSTSSLQASHLREWLRAWPWALILDGLDEVPSQEARRLVFGKIEELRVTADDLDADLLIVVTTRPTGYDERLPSDRFRHLELQRLSPTQAADFARRITDQRFTDDAEMRANVAERMAEAAKAPDTVRLMETPLQVTVMSFIVEKHPALPPDRFTLFDLFYRTMFEREAGKDIPIAKFLVNNRLYVDQLHEHVGLALQRDAEMAEGAEAVMSEGRLHELAVRLLVDRGFAATEADVRARELVEAATKRLVLLAPRGDGVGFEVRTLQELMAARALAEGDDTQVLQRLRTIAHHPHWHNTWLLAAGCLLVRSPRFEQLLLNLLAVLDTGLRRLSGRCPTAPTLAAAVLDDNLAANRPGFERGLVHAVFNAVDTPSVAGATKIAKALLRIAESGYRQLTYDRLTVAVNSGPARRAAAALALGEMANHARGTGPQTSVHRALANLALTAEEEQAVTAWLEAPRRFGGQGEATAAARLSVLLRPLDLPDDQAQALVEGLDVLADVYYTLSGPEPGTAILSNLAPTGDPGPLIRAMQRDDLAQALDMALEMLPPDQWALEAALCRAVFPVLDRTPVATDLDLHDESRSG